MLAKSPLIQITSASLRSLLALAVLGALFAVAPPARAQFGDGGSPILVIESYSTSPAPVRSGQEFTLTVTVKNTGTKHAEAIFASISASSSFVGLGAPAPIGLLDPGFSATFTLPVRAPENLASGAYDVPISFLYRIGDSGAYEIVRTVGIQASGSSTTSGQPQIVVESAEPVAPPQSVGDAFDLQITFHNVGTRNATAFTAALKLNDFISPAEGSGTTRVGDLPANQTKTITVRMIVDKASPTGRVPQTISLEYADANNKRYTSDETVSISLGAEAQKRPQLIVAEYTTTPERPAPGQEVILTLKVSNVGTGEARRVLVRLGEESGLKPFAPLGTSNVRFIASIPAESTALISQTLLVEGTAQGGAYTLPIALTYENSLGEAQTEKGVISLIVLARPQVQINLIEPLAAPFIAGDEFEIPVEVVNVGRQIVNVSTVEMNSAALTLTEASLYLGPLDAGTAGSLVARATAETGGAAAVNVIVHYLDDFNQEQTLTREFTFTIEPRPVVETTSGGDEGEPSLLESIWKAILGFFGLGG